VVKTFIGMVRNGNIVVMLIDISLFHGRDKQMRDGIILVTVGIVLFCGASFLVGDGNFWIGVKIMIGSFSSMIKALVFFPFYFFD